MSPNFYHLVRPAPIPPGVYTSRTFSACRPIVGVGDRHDVVQQVSNAVGEVTIYHKVNSPHNEQVSNVVLNMCPHTQPEVLLRDHGIHMDQVIFSGRQCCEGNILILNLAAIAFQEVFVGTNSYAFGISCPNFFIIIILILYLILSLRIKKVYRCELRSWKSIQLGLCLGNASMWKTLRTQLPKTSGQQCTQQPTCEEFASMLEGLFVGPVAIVRDAPTVLEQSWTLEELRLAINWIKKKEREKKK